jgi:hypothetical protein
MLLRTFISRLLMYPVSAVLTAVSTRPSRPAMVWKKNSLGVSPLKKLLATKPRPAQACITQFTDQQYVTPSSGTTQEAVGQKAAACTGICEAQFTDQRYKTTSSGTTQEAVGHKAAACTGICEAQFCTQHTTSQAQMKTGLFTWGGKSALAATSAEGIVICSAQHA